MSYSYIFIFLDDRHLNNNTQLIHLLHTTHRGMPPEMMKAMMGDEELVTMLRSPKFQDIMKLMMEGGQSELEKKMTEDPETYECLLS